MVRSLNKEQQVKVYKGATGKPALVTGKYDEGKYGIAYYNTAGVKIYEFDGVNTIKYNASGAIISVDDGKKTVYYDADDARILIGQAPDDNRIGIWVSKVGEDVLTLLGA
jgi:hypothetical protein